jgi:uncharacterized membrane protein YeaQ/YmgE (transglycosylase-associated protein family)
LEQKAIQAEAAVTVAAWILLGTMLGLVARAAMPVPHDGGKLPPVIAGVCTACLGGGLAVVFSIGGLLHFNPYSVAWAAIASMYALFAFRCFTMRARG